uniref:Uncharacterized protein n=1 Tax=Rhizophagus irregularis (strain DAOM 181602 / DAOM 197198 / MUCL 43194) TaxID=747089 RepID=U9TCF3_RHIID
MDIFSWFDSALFTVLFDSFWLQKELLDATLLLGLLLLEANSKFLKLFLYFFAGYR